MVHNPVSVGRVSDAREHAFICLHASHDVRRLRDHDNGFEVVVGGVAKSSDETTFGSSIFGQQRARTAYSQLRGEGLEARKKGVRRVHRRLRHRIREDHGIGKGRLTTRDRCAEVTNPTKPSLVPLQASRR